jgi:two-component system LytT family response regulator
MRKIKVLIVDDEIQAIRRIERLLSEESSFEVTGRAFNTIEASDSMLENKPDLLFLDIEMPGMNGVDFMKSLDEKTRPLVVFVTAYDEYAVMAFEYFAIDYILKPFSNERFIKTLSRVKSQLKNSSRQNIDWSLVSNFVSNNNLPQDRITIKTGRNYEFIAFESIMYIKADGAYVEIHCRDGRKLLHRETITSLEQKLNSFNFIRIHHSTVVAARDIKGIHRLSFGNFELIMNDGNKLRVSRKYKEQVRIFLK